LLRNSASTLSNELRCSVKSRLDAEQEFQQKESKLSSDLSARDAELANLKAMVEDQAAELLAKFAQLEEDNNRLAVENGRLDFSFEDRVQTEVEDRDQCITGLKDKCERMKRELEEAERAVEQTALERAEQEIVLQGLREGQEADRKRMNAVIEDLSMTLEELQAKWVAEKAQSEKEKEELLKDREAMESKLSEIQEELRLATEKFAVDRTAYRTQAQRLINDLNNEIRVACSQRKDADIAHKTIKEELVGVQNELRSMNAAKKELERKVKRWEEEVKALDAMWKEVGLVSGRWETARALFTQLASQTRDFDRWVKEVEISAQPNSSELELPQVDTPENPAVRESTEISAAMSGETSVYQIPAKRTPLLVSSSPVDIWPINEEQVPSWIPFPSEPTSAPTITRRPSFGGQGQKTLGHSASAERLTRGMNNVNVPLARDQVTKPAVRSGSGLRMCLGNASSADLSPTDFGRELPRHAASASASSGSVMSSVPSESTIVTSAAPSVPKGSLFESMHAPRRMLVAPVVCETVASGGVTQTSGIFNVPGTLVGQARDTISFQAGTGRGFSGSH
jgi:chromosome segregation ATPase